MIKNIGKYYLYRHLRLDKNEPFYIGIGTKTKPNSTTIKSEYSRAYMTCNRSVLWKNVRNKTEYEVEILLESDNYYFIKQKEIEFILLYKRKDCCAGTLTNLTDGGDGNTGYILPQSQLANISNSLKKLYSGEDYINPQSKEIIDTVTKETFLSLRQASTVKKINISSLSEMLTGKLRDTTSLCYKKDYFGQIIEPDNRKYKSKIINSETKEIYDNFSDLSRKMNIDKATISKKIRGILPNNTYFMYLWEYDLNPITRVKQKVKNSTAIMLKNIEDGNIFYSIKEASDFYNISYNNLKTEITKGCAIKQRFRKLEPAEMEEEVNENSEELKLVA